MARYTVAATCTDRTIYPRRDMRIKVAFAYVLGGLDRRVRRAGLEQWVAWLAGPPGITERV